jgi:hypothetical protein
MGKEVQMIVLKTTDTAIPAIEEHVNRQLARGDIVTLTRAQVLALLEAAHAGV